MSPAVQKAIEEFLASEQVTPEEAVKILTEHRAQLRASFDRAQVIYESRLSQASS